MFCRDTSLSNLFFASSDFPSFCGDHELRMAVEIKRTGPKAAEEISRWSLKTPSFETSEAALRAIHGYECVVRGVCTSFMLNVSS